MWYWFVGLAAASDPDGDGFEGSADNCPLVAQLDQADGDGDGVGDACDVCVGAGDGLERFGPASRISDLPASTFWLAASDLDGDGDQDLISSSLVGGELARFDNLGGSFGPQELLSTGLDAGQVRAVDLDGDGDPDVLAALGADVVWLENLGGALAAPAVLVAGAGSVSDLVAADVDGDADLDLVATVSGVNEVRWLENTGGLQFGAAVVLASGLTPPGQVMAADLDGDVDVDIVWAETFGDTAYWQENLGGGSFGPPLAITSSAGDGFDLVDVDGDGDLDAVYAGPHYFVPYDEPALQWAENLGGAFGVDRLLAPTLEAGTTLLARDFDGDGAVDPVLLTSADVRVFDHVGGYYGAVYALPEEALQTYAVLAADVDGDGWDDLVVGSANDGLMWFRNQAACRQLDTDGDGLSDPEELRRHGTDPLLADTDGDGVDDGEELQVGTSPLLADTDGDGVLDGSELCAPWRAGQPLERPDDASREVIAADLDLDGRMDVVATSWDNDRVTWFPQLDDGTFAPGQILHPGANGADALAVGDVDGDGAPDLLASFTGQNVVRSFLAGVDGPVAGPDVDAALPNPVSLAVGDLDGDDDIDVLAGGRGSDVLVLDNLGAGAFSQHVLSGSAPGVASVELADLDGDGALDAVAGGASVPQLSWFLNDGTGAFGLQQIAASVAVTVTWVEAVDLDGDGDQDIVYTGYNGYTVGLLENLGGGVFGAAQTLDVPADLPWAVAAGDVDRDGDPDLVVATDGGGLRTYENLGGLSFGGGQPLGRPGRTNGVVLADLDADGDPDAVSSTWSGPVTWYENLSDCAYLDTDADGLPDDVEGTLGTDPADPDTDHDGYSDGEEFLVLGSDPLDAASPGSSGDTAETGLPSETGLPEDTGLPKDTGLPEDTGRPGETGALADTGETGAGTTDRPERGPVDPEGTDSCGCAAGSASSGTFLPAFLFWSLARHRD